MVPDAGARPRLAGQHLGLGGGGRPDQRHEGGEAAQAGDHTRIRKSKHATSPGLCPWGGAQAAHRGMFYPWWARALAPKRGQMAAGYAATASRTGEAALFFGLGLEKIIAPSSTAPKRRAIRSLA